MAGSRQYIALLRGINVGGHTVRMQDLRALFEELGLRKVRSFIQSGNLFFESGESDAASLARRIERRLRDALGYEVAVILKTIPELEAVLAANPFRGLEVRPDMRLCVVFAAQPIRRDLELPLFSPRKDLEILKTTQREAFVVWHLKDGRPPSSQSFLDQTLGERTTTRFFHTAGRILQAAQGGAKT